MFLFATAPVVIGTVLNLSDATLLNGTKVYGTVIAGALQQLALEVEPTLPGGATDIEVGIEARFGGSSTFVPVLSIRQGDNTEDSAHTFAAAGPDGADSLITTNLALADAWRVYAKSAGAVQAGTAITVKATGSAL